MEERQDLISRSATITEFKNYERDSTCPIDYVKIVEQMPPAQPEIIYCKNCVKHNKRHGYYHDGTVIGIKDCCPLIEIRGMAQGHEFDYQFCVYGKRRATT